MHNKEGCDIIRQCSKSRVCKHICCAKTLPKLGIQSLCTPSAPSSCISGSIKLSAVAYGPLPNKRYSLDRSPQFERTLLTKLYSDALSRICISGNLMHQTIQHPPGLSASRHAQTPYIRIFLPAIVAWPVIFPYLLQVGSIFSTYNKHLLASRSPFLPACSVGKRTIRLLHSSLSM